MSIHLSALVLALVLPLQSPGPPAEQPKTEPKQPSTEQEASEEVRRLSIDDLILRLPPAGEEWRWDRAANDGKEDPASAELCRRLATQKLTDEQWRTALLRTGSVRLRERWARGGEYAVSLTVPRWLGLTQIRLTPRAAGLSETRVGELFESISGTGALIDARDARLGRRLGTVPQESMDLTFDVIVERGEAGLSRLFKNDGDPDPPAAGVIWRGTITAPLTPVDDEDDVLPVTDYPALTEAVRDALGAGFRQWGGAAMPIAFIVIDPDCGKYPALETTGLDLKVEILRDGQPVDESAIVAMDADTLALMSSVSSARKTFYGSANLKGIPSSAATDAAEAARWSLRLSGQSKHTKYLWSAKARWCGSFTIAWTDAVKHEAERTGEQGRGPEASTPYWK